MTHQPNASLYTWLPSFDGTENIWGEFLRPDRYRQLLQQINDNPKVIARGGSLSYCAASAGEGVASISTSCFNRILGFDPKTGLVSVEPGISIGELFDFAISKGWFPPVMPGHPRNTVGGCVGFNVHGKSQFHGGNFGNWVEKLTIFHPAFGERECSSSNNTALFNLTIGGFGLTGFITRVDLRLQKLKGNSIRFRRLKAKNLFDAVNIMVEKANTADVLYSWNNLNMRGSSFGKGIVYVETFEAELIPSRVHFKSLSSMERGVLFFPFFNQFTIPLVFRGYQIKERISQAEIMVDLKTASFPINGKEIYFKLFGKRGFREYQMLIPHDAWEKSVPEIEKVIIKHCIPVALGSLKLFKGKTKHLNFSGDGICLAIDVPAIPKSLNFLNDLDHLVISFGGIVNLSKDSRVRAATIRKMFSEYEIFATGIREMDPTYRFDSALRRRLEI